VARSNDHERKRIQARRDANQKQRDVDAQREARVRARVDGLLNDALGRARKAPETLDRVELVARLEEHRQIALSVYPPLVRAANESVFMTAKLLGMIVDQQGVCAEPIALTGDVGEARARLLEQLSERMGSHKAAKLVEFLGKLRDDPDVIEGKANRDED
jgi:hypothetical protein